LGSRSAILSAHDPDQLSLNIRILEPISEEPQEDADAAEMDEAEEVLGVALSFAKTRRARDHWGFQRGGL
jgi:hypothetical protein